jgi:hypothetical protein
MSLKENHQNNCFDAVATNYQGRSAVDGPAFEGGHTYLTPKSLNSRQKGLGALLSRARNPIPNTVLCSQQR